jgi:hypothetical protein
MRLSMELQGLTLTGAGWVTEGTEQQVERESGDKAGLYEDGFHGERPDRPTGGRFPANLIHDGSDEVVDLFPNTKSPKKYKYKGKKDRSESVVKGFGAGYGVGHANEYGDTGSAARFFKQINELKEESD